MSERIICSDVGFVDEPAEKGKIAYGYATAVGARRNTGSEAVTSNATYVSDANDIAEDFCDRFNVFLKTPSSYCGPSESYGPYQINFAESHDQAKIEFRYRNRALVYSTPSSKPLSMNTVKNLTPDNFVDLFSEVRVDEQPQFRVTYEPKRWRTKSVKNARFLSGPAPRR
jgi:hypothetical protein